VQKNKKVASVNIRKGLQCPTENSQTTEQQRVKTIKQYN